MCKGNYFTCISTATTKTEWREPLLGGRRELVLRIIYVEGQRTEQERRTSRIKIRVMLALILLRLNLLLSEKL